MPKKTAPAPATTAPAPVPAGPPPTCAMLLGDSLDLLKGLPDGCVDAVVTDPPYSSGGMFRGDRTNATTTSKYVQSGQKKEYADFLGDNRDQRSHLAWSRLWLAECLRVAKPGAPIMVFTDWRQLPTTTDAIQVGGWIWRGIVVWDKTPGVRPTKGRFTAQAEYIVWGSKGPWLHKDGPCLPGVHRCHPKPASKRHIAGKPVEVMSWLLGVVPAGGVILDPFAGSASTGVAAAAAGFDFIGCECLPHYHAVSCERLAAAGAAVTCSLPAKPAPEPAAAAPERLYTSPAVPDPYPDLSGADCAADEEE